MGSFEAFTNGSTRQIYPWGGISSSSVMTSANPLLESLLPTQARLFPLTMRRVFQPTSGEEEESNRLQLSLGVVAAKSLRERLVEKVILVSPVLWLASTES